jgi:CheY-like chemotaxis protein
MLAAVTRVLRNDFDVVATVTDGRQALELAVRLDPDVIVMDLMMPEMDGLRAAREVRRTGLRARIVVMTMHQTDDLVMAAIDAGAQGYVVKTNLHADLVSAIDHALAGRLFFPSVVPMSMVAGQHGQHTTLLHGNDRLFLAEAGRLVGAALRSGEPVVIAGMDATRIGVAQRLREQHLDIENLERQGLYSTADAVDALAGIMRDAGPDPDSLAKVVDGLERARRALGDASGPRLTILGEIAVPLCRSGRLDDVLEIERLWNRLTRALPFFTVCCYPIDGFRHAARPTLFPAICDEHWAVSHA